MTKELSGPPAWPVPELVLDRLGPVSAPKTNDFAATVC